MHGHVCPRLAIRKYSGPVNQQMSQAVICETMITANIGMEFSGCQQAESRCNSFEDNLWYLGNHTPTFGTHNEITKSATCFIQASEGACPLWITPKTSPQVYLQVQSDPDMTGGNLKYAPVMKAGQSGFYAQDQNGSSQETSTSLTVSAPIFLCCSTNPTVNPTSNDFAAGRNMGVRVGETRVPS